MNTMTRDRGGESSEHDCCIREPLASRLGLYIDVQALRNNLLPARRAAVAVGDAAFEGDALVVEILGAE